jgi:hypothetical protein
MKRGVARQPPLIRTAATAFLHEPQQQQHQKGHQRPKRATTIVPCSEAQPNDTRAKEAVCIELIVFPVRYRSCWSGRRPRAKESERERRRCGIYHGRFTIIINNNNKNNQRR